LPAAISLADTYVLGTHQYRPSTGALTDASGQTTFLRPQSAHVLEILVARAGELVSKDDLIGEVWPDISVTDDSLTQCIADIRRTLKDSARKILRTLAKRGYMIDRDAVLGPVTGAQPPVALSSCVCPLCPHHRQQSAA
jgi:adenylate cyclase